MSNTGKISQGIPVFSLPSTITHRGGNLKPTSDFESFVCSNPTKVYPLCFIVKRYSISNSSGTSFKGSHFSALTLTAL